MKLIYKKFKEKCEGEGGGGGFRIMIYVLVDNLGLIFIFNYV